MQKGNGIMGFSIGRLFGYEKVVSANTPELCFKNMYRRVKNGEPEMLVYISQLSMLTQQILEETSGLIKGYLQRYLIQIFEKTNLQAMKIKEYDNKVIMQVTGVTANFNYLLELFYEKINELEPQLGLRTGGKINLRKIGLMLNFLEECIKTCGTVNIKDEIILEKGEIYWEVRQTPSLSNIFLGMKSDKVEQKIQHGLSYLWSQK